MYMNINIYLYIYIMRLLCGGKDTKTIVMEYKQDVFWVIIHHRLDEVVALEVGQGSSLKYS